jgi:hypothetical protein
LSVLTSPLDSSQLTFSLFLIHFLFFLLFYLNLNICWIMYTFKKKGCFRRCFLKLISETALFCKIILEPASGIQHLLKLIFLSFFCYKLHIWKDKYIQSLWVQTTHCSQLTISLFRIHFPFFIFCYSKVSII